MIWKCIDMLKALEIASNLYVIQILNMEFEITIAKKIQIAIGLLLRSSIE